MDVYAMATISIHHLFALRADLLISCCYLGARLWTARLRRVYMVAMRGEPLGYRDGGID
jgi:hypothetical protein